MAAELILRIQPLPLLNFPSRLGRHTHVLDAGSLHYLSKGDEAGARIQKFNPDERLAGSDSLQCQPGAVTKLEAPFGGKCEVVQSPEGINVRLQEAVV